MRALYISQNGMLENLGQSQVLPYVRGLARRGVEYDLFAFELDSAPEDALAALRADLAKEGIRYHPLTRKRDPRLRAKVLEAGRGTFYALVTALLRRPHVIHGRSYFPSAICDLITTVSPSSKLLFDCRGMLADEYVDCGYWSRDRPEYYLVKAYEERLFAKAHGLVVLTSALRDWLQQNGWLREEMLVEAIPCCADIPRFVFTPEHRALARATLGLTDETCVMYAGSLGPVYREPEMARFVGRLVARDPRTTFCVLTPGDSTNLRELAIAAGLPPSQYRTMRVAPSDMPTMLAGGDLALSFIQSSFSKKGSSPTKVGEYLAAGLPIVVNGDIGDQAALAANPEACVVLDSFSDAQVTAATERVTRLARQPIAERTVATLAAAREHFGLETVGIPRYERLYRALARK